MSELCEERLLKMFEVHDKVVEALAERRFVVLLGKGFKVYLFKGIKRDYIVSPCRFCTCEDFVINYIGKSREIPCYHVVGFRVAEINNKVVKVELDIATLTKILEEVFLDGISTTLRKVLK